MVDIIRIAIIDISGSMDSPFEYSGQPGLITRITSETHKFEAAKEYLRFAIQKMPRASKLILIAFASSAEVIYRGVAGDISGIENAIATLRADGSSTNLAAAFEKVIELLTTEGNAIRPLDIITDGLSNRGDPIPPARQLQKRFGTYIHIYLIDPTTEGKHTANEIVGNEGEVDPVASAEALRDSGRKSFKNWQAFHTEKNNILARQVADRHNFSQRTAEQERPKITVVSPEIMAPKRWSTVDVFIYLVNYRELVQKEIQRLQNRDNRDYSRTSSEFPRTLPEGCPIRVILSSTSLRANPSEMTICWYEPYNRLSFRVSAIDHDLDDYSASLDVDVFADDLPVASMRLPIAITSSLSIQPTEPAMAEAQWYENIFASYDREDLEIVEHLKERYEALGLYLFVDLDDLRAGARWRPELFDHIDSSDLFQLFWSHSSKKSKYVAIEWEHALRAQKIKGGRFIRPLYWEKPIPEIPDELARINFRRITFAKK